MAYFILSGAFLVEVLANARLGVGHVAFEVLVSLFGFLFAFVELRLLLLLRWLLLLVLLFLLLVRDEFGESFGRGEGLVARRLSFGKGIGDNLPGGLLV